MSDKSVEDIANELWYKNSQEPLPVNKNRMIFAITTALKAERAQVIAMTHVKDTEKRMRRNAEARVKELEKDSYECTCTDPKEDPYGILCRYCYVQTALEVCKNHKDNKDRIKQLEAEVAEKES